MLFIKSNVRENAAMELIPVYVKSHKASASLFIVQLEAQLGVQYSFSVSKETNENDPQHMGMFSMFHFSVFSFALERLILYYTIQNLNSVLSEQVEVF